METQEEPKLLALKRYEKAASEEREVMLMSILPGREPPAAGPILQPVMPSVSSQVLPTHPDALRYPDKTLETLPATGVLANLSARERKDLRWEDNRYCANYFAGHVVLSPLDVVLTRLGSSLLVERLAHLTKVASTRLSTQLKNAVLVGIVKESKPADFMTDTRYWLSRLADVRSVR
ncbi:hypothetical protein B0H12DRAFT_386684 [Mycena haematopus]|nr:hypothetical protein B0H12DRAFT_386684 [Mycena haematopus]